MYPVHDRLDIRGLRYRNTVVEHDWSVKLNQPLSQSLPRGPVRTCISRDVYRRALVSY